MSDALCGVGDRRLQLAVAFALSALWLTGCAGSATVHTIAIGSKKISTTGPLIVRIDPDECYWWLDDAGRLCVAMRESKGLPFSKVLRREFFLSLVLGDPPAGAARNYRVDRRTLRFRRDAGYGHTRAASLGGIAAVWEYGHKTLKGRFRINALRQSYLVLTGWRTDARILVLGEFTAVRNREKGEGILARTEEDEMAREWERDK